jgi:multimeric flavodoxin WrbA
MTSQGRALLLIGSARQPRSTSESLGTYLLERLRERGFATDSLFVHRSLRSDKGREELLAATDRADILVLACPLYWDSLPSLVTEAMELLARHRQERDRIKEQRLLAIVNCGFPEAHHTATALAICGHFAGEAGFEWVGGLGLGAGPLIDGRPLAKAGRASRNAIKSLDLAVQALSKGSPLPQKAVQRMAKPLVPIWAFPWAGGLILFLRARKHGAHMRMRARVYQR